MKLIIALLVLLGLSCKEDSSWSCLGLSCKKDSSSSTRLSWTRTDEWGITQATWLFCISEEDLDAAASIAASGDEMAFGTFLQETPGCGLLRGGMRAYVTKNTFRKVRFRVEGQTVEVWALRGAVQ